MTTDPKAAGATPPLLRQQQEPPGFTEELDPKPDHGEHSYRCGSKEYDDRKKCIVKKDGSERYADRDDTECPVPVTPTLYMFVLIRFPAQ